MRHKTVLSSVAAAVLCIGLGSVALAQEADTTLNALTTAKLAIKVGPNTVRGCKAVYSGSYSPSNPSGNPFQLIVEIDPQNHYLDIPTTSTLTNAKVTFKAGSGEAQVSFGTLQDLEEKLFQQSLDKVDWEKYHNAKVVIKGCSKVNVPLSAYVEAINRLRPIAFSIMFGEPCSTVPVFKKKSN